MNLFGFLFFVIWIHSNQAAISDVTDQINSDRDETCSHKARDCFENPGEFGVDFNYRTNDVSLIDVSVSDEGNGCCYEYSSVYTGNADCTEKTPAQSHWILSYICPQQTITGSMAFGAVLGSDKSSCLKGIKFEHECGANENPCSYQVCIVWPNFINGKCCTENGWYMIKAGHVFAFGEVEVPRCICETDSPTFNPTKTPTRIPSDIPTPNPTNNPSKEPSSDPSNIPTRSPTNNPTSAPTYVPTQTPTDTPTSDPSHNPTPKPTENPTPAPTGNPTANPSMHPTVSPTNDPFPAPTNVPTTSPTHTTTTSPTHIPTTSPTVNPTSAPIPYCQPIIEISVNTGCTAENIELHDTDIVYVALKEYENLTRVARNLTISPHGSLSQIVLDHACKTDNVLAAANTNKGNSDFIDYAPIPMKNGQKMSTFLNYPQIYYVCIIGFFVVYSVVITFMYFRKNTFVNLSVDVEKVYDSANDSGDDGDSDNMP